MRIFVCIKQVPEIEDAKIDPKTGMLIREGVPSIINPVDKNALELALTIKERTGCEVIALSMGPPQAEEALREALAMGVDKAFLLSDKKFAGADTLATSYTLSLSIKNTLSAKEKYLVICGSQAMDGDTAQVGPELAEELNIPHITNVQKFELKDDKITVESIFNPEEIVILEVELPALVSVLKTLNTPRFPTLISLVEAYDTKKVTYLSVADLNPDLTKIGLNGSQTQVAKIFIPQTKGEHIKLSGSISEMIKQLCQNLKDDKILLE